MEWYHVQAKASEERGVGHASSREAETMGEERRERIDNSMITLITLITVATFNFSNESESLATSTRCSDHLNL